MSINDLSFQHDKKIAIKIKQQIRSDQEQLKRTLDAINIGKKHVVKQFSAEQVKWRRKLVAISKMRPSKKSENEPLVVDLQKLTISTPKKKKDAIKLKMEEQGTKTLKTDNRIDASTGEKLTNENGKIYTDRTTPKKPNVPIYNKYIGLKRPKSASTISDDSTTLKTDMDVVNSSAEIKPKSSDRKSTEIRSSTPREIQVSSYSDTDVEYNTFLQVPQVIKGYDFQQWPIGTPKIKTMNIFIKDDDLISEILPNAVTPSIKVIQPSENEADNASDSAFFKTVPPDNQDDLSSDAVKAIESQSYRKYSKVRDANQYKDFVERTNNGNLKDKSNQNSPSKKPSFNDDTPRSRLQSRLSGVTSSNATSSKQDSPAETRVLEWLWQNSNGTRRRTLPRVTSQSVFNLTSSSPKIVKELRFNEDLESVHEHEETTIVPQNHDNLTPKDKKRPRSHSFTDVKMLHKFEENLNHQRRLSVSNNRFQRSQSWSPPDSLTYSKDHEEQFRIDLRHLREPTPEKMEQLKRHLLQSPRSCPLLSNREYRDSRIGQFSISPKHKLLDCRSVISSICE